MKVKFLPQNIEVEANPNKSLLQIATENQIEIRSICKGVPSCAECRVKLVDGENNCFPPTKAELNLIGTNYFIDGRRLSCQVRCFGDITVDLTEQVDKAENQTKKIRGYRQQGKQNESHAVNDTMLLNEKIDVSQNSQEDKRSDEGPGPQAQSGQKQQQQAQNRQRQNQPQQQQKNKQQQGQGRGNPGNNQGGQQQGQGKSQNKSQDKPQGRRRR
jgi:ferredoxin